MSSRLSITVAEAQLAPAWKQAGKPWLAGLLFLSLTFGLSGCGFLISDSPFRSIGGPIQAKVPGVPFYPQEELQCGPAALAMALTWSGITVKPKEISSQVYMPGLEGSLQSAMLGSARRHGRVAYPVAGAETLLTEIAAGHPVIVLVNLGFSWFPRWHYAVVLGYDREEDEVLMHSGQIAEEKLNSRTFMNLWRRSDYWGVLVLAPDQLPATVEQEQWLKAVAGLESAGEYEAAAVGYAAALERWDRNFAAWMGLGNSRYRLQDLDGAVAAFRRAAQLDPENGMAFNNLAHVLAELGHREDALAAARRAMARGGPLRAAFQQTFEEIKAMPGP